MKLPQIYILYESNVPLIDQEGTVERPQIDFGAAML
jgi:hypothetical protein